MQKWKSHMLCVSPIYPAQGHINPMTKLAKLLHSEGFHISFVNTHYNHNRLLRSRGPSSLDGLPDFRFYSIPDGLPPSDAEATQSIPELCETVPKHSLEPICDLITELNSVLPVSCIVSDGCMSFTLEAAKRFGLPEVLFWTTSACGLLAYTRYRDLVQKGYTPLKEAEKPGGSGQSKSPLDVTNPYFLTAADHPGLNFVGENLLHDGNYGDWQNEMVNALFAKNKIGFVDGTLLMPAENDPDFMNWKRCNGMVRGWLVCAMEKEIKSSVKYAATARDIWVDLKERFGTENAPRAYELRRTITMIRQDNMTVSAYFTKLRGVWDEVQAISPSPSCTCQGCTCEVNKEIAALREKERLYDFLMGLNEEYGAIRTQILSTRPLPTLVNAYHVVSQDEQQKKIGTSKTMMGEAAAFQTANKVNYKGTQRSNGPANKREEKKKEDRWCTHCQKTGHTIDGCFEIVGYPDWWIQKPSVIKPQPVKGKPQSRAAAVTDESTFSSITKEEYDQLIQLLRSSKTNESKSAPMANMSGKMKSNPAVNMIGKIKKQDPWIIDSGATDHITYLEKLLKSINKTKDFSNVTVPNGESAAIKSIGNIQLPNSFKLKDVLNVPDFKCNLLSVSKLTQDIDCSITFLRNLCYIQDLHSKNLIGMGKKRDGLYYLEPVEKEKMAMHVLRKYEVWHRRLGHTSEAVLRKIQQIGNLGTCNDFCDSCIRAKQGRLPFPISFAKTDECFDLIHIDIWGRYKHASLNGAYYFLSIVDDYSRGVWVYLMKNKSDAADLLVSFYAMVETQFNKRIKRIRTDNGSEFRSRFMQSFYLQKGILLETTCPYTPEQNGIVERKHRHLLEMGRALRFEASLPIEFWGECVLTAAYIINKLPTPVLDNKSPHEILLGKVPTYEHLRTFGCLAYAHDNLGKQDKFNERGRPCVFLGYPNGQKGYKLYDLKSQKMHITRNVTFVESEFPFSEGYKGHKVIPNEHLAEALQQVENISTHVPVITTEATVDQGEDMFDVNENSEDIIMTDEHEAENQSDQQPIDNTPMQTTENSVHDRQSRPRVMPKRFDGFLTDLPPSLQIPTSSSSTHNPVYPLSQFVSYNKFSNTHKAFLAAITLSDEPKTFAQASQNPMWIEAMKKEIEALEQNGTWILMELPPGKRAIDSKWVYKIKYKPNGEVERYKARLVAKGFTQIEGIDFHETFAPVAKLVTVRCALAIASKKGWEVHQMDVNNAFLHGDLQEEVYMKVPQGFLQKNENRVCKLEKSIYGLRQASRNWYQKFTKSLIDVGFDQSKADHSMFVFRKTGTHIVALIYVDDILLMGNNMDKIDEVKQHLQQCFSIKDLGPLKYFLGIEVARSKEGFVLSQRKYTLDILEDTGALASKPSMFPMEQNVKLRTDDISPEVDASRYRRLVGRLLYLTVTRPDIAYSVNLLSQFLNKPKKTHMDAAFRVLRYLKTTPGQGLFLPSAGSMDLLAFCDASWLSCLNTRRSVTGYYISIGGSPVSWRTKKQTVVSRSSAEAEYRAMASTVCEVIWLRWLLHDLDAVQSGPTPLMCDNEAARHIAANPVYHERTKHVEMDCYFVRERILSGEVKTHAIRSEYQTADIFTKPLGAARFKFLRGKLGVCDLHSPT